MYVTDVMDSDYVLFNNQTSTASPPMNTVLARRTRAMRQWGVLRADVEYQNAERCIQNMTHSNSTIWNNYVGMMAEWPVDCERNQPHVTRFTRVGSRGYIHHEIDYGPPG